MRRESFRRYRPPAYLSAWSYAPARKRTLSAEDAGTARPACLSSLDPHPSNGAAQFFDQALRVLRSARLRRNAWTAGCGLRGQARPVPLCGKACFRLAASRKARDARAFPAIYDVGANGCAVSIQLRLLRGSPPSNGSFRFASPSLTSPARQSRSRPFAFAR